jgi:uncharacterized RDD family membrane protein YckC
MVSSAAAPPAPPSVPPAVPGLTRRLASMLYEGILLFGVVFIPAYLFSALLQFKDNQDSPLRHVFQAYMFAAIGLYFVICWRRTGQTLPMKTWKFKLFTADGGKPSVARAWLRYALTWIGPFLGVLVYKLVVELTGVDGAHFSAQAFWVALPFFLLNWLWAWIDAGGQFLHDRLAGTRLFNIA